MEINLSIPNNQKDLTVPYYLQWFKNKVGLICNPDQPIAVGDILYGPSFINGNGHQEISSRKVVSVIESRPARGNYKFLFKPLYMLVSCEVING